MFLYLQSLCNVVQIYWRMFLSVKTHWIRKSTGKTNRMENYIKIRYGEEGLFGDGKAESGRHT